MKPARRRVGTPVHTLTEERFGPPPDAIVPRSWTVAMPQMAVGGLGEGRLFRELGYVHWERVARAYRSMPHGITDAAGKRLYATFVRVRWEGNEHLKQFREGERLTLGCDLTQYGSSVFFSDHEIHGEGKKITATTMTVFVSRSTADNRALRRSQPQRDHDAWVPQHDAMPPIGVGYRSVRDDRAQTIELGGELFAIGDTPLFESEYTINPYYEINGVNLLYFAAYPAINDTCERRVAHAHPETFGVLRDWAFEASTLARDVFYLGNCDARDTLTYRLFSVEPAGTNRIKLASCLYRNSDGAKVATILTLKALTR